MKVRLERVTLVIGMTLAALNIWTGAPLLGLWIGSRLTGGERITTLAVFATVGERAHGVRPTLTALEYLLVGMVVLAVLLFEAWFFFFSGSPFDQRSGR